jgi:hypothetical protein
MAAWLPQPFTEPFGSVANPLTVPAADRLLGVANVALAVSVLAVPVGAWSLAVRFRRARGVERQQLRWLAPAAALVAAGAVVIVVLLVAGIEGPLGLVYGIACPAAAGHRSGRAGLPAVRPGPHHQPHPGLRAADRAARPRHGGLVLVGGQLFGG